MKPEFGNKANNLEKMKAAGFNVPPFAVFTSVPSEPVLADSLRCAGLSVSPHDDSAAPRSGDPLSFDGTAENSALRYTYAVRSSADIEDGEDSFAGQFVSFLDIEYGDLAARISDCFEKAHDPALAGYMESRGNEREINMAVIVQEMIAADCSGVLFTRDPAGVASQAYAEIEAGTGGITSDSDSVVLEYRYSYPDAAGFSLVRGCPGSSSFEDCRIFPSEGSLAELAEAGERLEALFGEPQDIEFAYRNGKLYLLQSRRITDGTPVTAAEGSAAGRITLDNSNIVESYPGITLPLTDSFVREVYSEIFTALMKRLCGRLSEEDLEMTRNMVASVDGRMYYQIDNWYRIIRMLPDARRIIPVWERSLGVENDDAKQHQKPHGAGIFRKIRIAGSAAALFRSTPVKMEKLEETFLRARQAFEESLPKAASVLDLFRIYDGVMKDVMKEWDITLVNDMYAFVMTALAKRKNGKIAGIRDIASLKPLLAMYRLAETYRKDGDSPDFRAALHSYRETYGDRIIGELKLETVTYRQDEAMLMSQIKALAGSPGFGARLSHLRKAVEDDGGDDGFFAGRAKAAIGWREFSRMNRSRLYGFARGIFLKMGYLLCKEGRLENERDVFYLRTDELRDNAGRDYRETVAERKKIYSVYAAMPARRRIVFASGIINTPTAQVIIDAKRHQSGRPANKSDHVGNISLSGRVCSRGGDDTITGEPLVVDEEALKDFDPAVAAGKIIIARTTDPGWVFLLSQARAIVAEKGSMLSHTAIVSRELKIPAIVAVTGACAAFAGVKKITLDLSKGTVTTAG